MVKLYKDKMGESFKQINVDLDIFEKITESDEDDDEFFDCDDDELMNSNGSPTTAIKSHKPAGRQRKCGRLRLLKSGEPMYIPITQV